MDGKKETSSTSQPFLEVKDLTVYYTVSKVDTKAVNGVSFRLERGKTLGLVGETGAGKTTIAKAIMGILPTPPARLMGGEIHFDGQELTALPEAQMLKIRGDKISMIFQDPMTALNPVIKVGDQIAEVIELHNSFSKAEAKKRAGEMLEMVGIPASRYSEYPHQFSGGMKQRVAIARAYAVNPSLLLMDEPFGALDAQTRTQLQTELLRTWEEEKKTCFFITHDVEEAILLASKVIIMSARPGRIREVLDIDIPYPRTQETKILPRFTELKNYIWNIVYREYLEVQQ